MKIGQNVWHSSRINEPNSEITRYTEPREIKTRLRYFTVMPATSRNLMEVMPYGEDLQNTWIAIAQGRMFYDARAFILGQPSFKDEIASIEDITDPNVIKIGDLFYLDGVKPILQMEQEYGYGSTANAVVKSITQSNHSITVILTRNKNQVKV